MRTEFEFIRNIKNKYGLKHIGDDCAVLPKDAETDMVITADMLVEDIDFRLDWTTPEFLGHKALAVSLSDVAAMGAVSKWATLSIAVPMKIWKSDFVDAFYEGWSKLAKQFGVELIGGDVSRSVDKVVVDSVVIGTVAKDRAIWRSGAKPGDGIYVTGWLGGAAGGLLLLESGLLESAKEDSPARQLINKQLKPQPPVRIGWSLQSSGLVHSMIDTSDGISSDLAHVCTASRVGAKLFAESLPIHYSLAGFFDPDKCLEFALSGGEDFELLFTADKEKFSHLKFDEISLIGEVTQDVGIIELIRNGQSTILEAEGYRHF